MIFGNCYSTQCRGDFNIDDKLSINCAIVKGTSGRGRVRLIEETVSKRSILTIKNSDNLCLLRSLVVAHAYAVRGQNRSGKLHGYWNLIRHSNSSVQKEAAGHIVSLSATQLPTDGLIFSCF